MIEINIKQGDDQWHVERHGCVTGTKLESAIGACYSSAKNEWIMGGKVWSFEGDKLVSNDDATPAKAKTSVSKQHTMILELVSDLQSELEIDDYCSADMQRGNDLEPLSVEAASAKHKVNFEVCGMLQSDTMERFKFSPDAIHKSNGIIVGGYETKSKMGKKHIEYQLENRLPPEHLMQCLCPMIMDDCVKWWIFGHFDDRNHVNNLFTTGIKRENYEDFIQCARGVLLEFFEKLNETVNKMGGVYNG